MALLNAPHLHDTGTLLSRSTPGFHRFDSYLCLQAARKAKVRIVDVQEGIRMDTLVPYYSVANQAAQRARTLLFT